MEDGNVLRPWTWSSLVEEYVALLTLITLLILRGCGVSPSMVTVTPFWAVVTCSASCMGLVSMIPSRLANSSMALLQTFPESMRAAHSYFLILMGRKWLNCISGH